MGLGGLLRFAVFVGALVAARASAALAPGDSTGTLLSGGVERSYLLHVPPSYDGSAAVPLVLDFHGFNSNGAQQKLISGLVPVADREGFLLAHPEGLGHAWNAGLCCGNPDVDDVAFVRLLVGTLAGQASVDLRRVYATGLSNGGAMSQRLACDAADLIAAAAPMAFPVPFRPLSECQPARAVPVLTFMGLFDVLIPYAGGFFPSAPETFAFWRDVDGCPGGTLEAFESQGESRCERYTRCTSGVEAGLCSVASHAFAGTGVSGHILYFNDDLVLAEVAWAFLSRFRLPAVASPVHAMVRGGDLLRLSNGRADPGSSAWQVTLGDGTWSASDGAGLVIGGSAHGRSERRMLALSTDAGGVLGTQLGVRAAALGSAEDVAPRALGRLTALVGRSHLRLIGRIGLAGGGVFSLRLQGPIAPSP